MTNKTIVDIRVHSKLNPGDVWFNVYDRQPFTIQTRPYYKPFLSAGVSWWIDVKDNNGNVRCLSLEDAGVPGFQYDDRPFKWVRTEAEIESRLLQYQQWNYNLAYYN